MVTINPITTPTIANTNHKTSIVLIVRNDLSIDPRCINGSVCGPLSTYPQSHLSAVGRFTFLQDGQFIAEQHSTHYSFGLGPRLPRHARLVDLRLFHLAGECEIGLNLLSGLIQTVSRGQRRG